MEMAAEQSMELTHRLVERFPLGCVLCQVVSAGDDRVGDLRILAMNASFEALSGLSGADVGGKISETIAPRRPGISARMKALGEEALASPEKRVAGRISSFSLGHRVTIIALSESVLLAFYEDVRPQIHPVLPAAGDSGGDGATALDSLTGLYGRIFAVEALKHMVAQEVAPLSIVLGDVDGLKMINDALGYRAGDEILTSVARVLRANCRAEDIVARWGDDEFLLILPNSSGDETQSVLKRLRNALEHERRGPAPATLTFGFATSETALRNAEGLVEEAAQWVYRKKLLESRSYRNGIIRLLLSTLHEKCAETQQHSDRMAGYCRHIAERFGLSDEMVNDLLLLAMLHDIGKVGIRHEILTKPGPLSPEERLEVQRHPEIGYKIAKNIPELAQVSTYILAHHEWWNGRGYPFGLSGEGIPLPSRIIAVVDAFDVMLSGRVYRAARSREEALAELRRCAGTQFDPGVVDVLTEFSGDDPHAV